MRIGSWIKNQTLQLHTPIENNWIQEISQFTCDIRYLPAKSNQVSDFLSRPFDCPEPKDYINAEDFIAALEIKIKNLLEPDTLQAAQKECPEVKAHRQGQCPKGVMMQDVDIGGYSLYCEVTNIKKTSSPCPSTISVSHFKSPPPPRSPWREGDSQKGLWRLLLALPKEKC